MVHAPGFEHGIQGNLDPAVLVAPFDGVATRAVTNVLNAANGRPGHIFNLGHGVMPGISIDTLARLVDFVHTNTSTAS